MPAAGESRMIVDATIAGSLTGLATLVGAIPILFIRERSEQRQNMLLGFAAGVMLSASYLSLIVPAADFAVDIGYPKALAALLVAVAVIIGAASLDILRHVYPFDRAPVGIGGNAPPGAIARTSLLIFAMTAHNLPEGVAVGVGFGAGEPMIGISTAIGIGVQNLPEGLAVAAALISVGVTGWRAVLIAGATGLVEPVGAFLGAALVTWLSELLPFGMGWAAGAMLYIVAAELIPAIHGNGRTRGAIAALVAGLAAMLFLDIALG